MKKYGFHISMMESETLNYDSPLYGRRDGQIQLSQIPFRHYHDFFPGKQEDELIQYYAVTGGVPRYIEMLANTTDLMKAIETGILDSQSMLFEEPYFLLTHEVRDIDTMLGGKGFFRGSSILITGTAGTGKSGTARIPYFPSNPLWIGNAPGDHAQGH